MFVQRVELSAEVSILVKSLISRIGCLFFYELIFKLNPFYRNEQCVFKYSQSYLL